MKFTHIGLTVSNVDRSVAFFEAYTNIHVVHRRTGDSGGEVAWLTDEDLHKRFVVVLIEMDDDNGALRSANHLGFAVDSRVEVDAIAERARKEDILRFEPRDAGPVVGYLCVIEDPDGNSIEFSYGQELG